MVVIIAVVVADGVGVCGIAGIVGGMIVPVVCGVSVPCGGAAVVVVAVVARVTRFVADRFVLCQCSACAPKIGLRVVVVVRMTVNI